MERAPATHTTTDRRLGRLPSGAELSVTVHRYVGADGPTVYVQAAQHGIELNGPATLRRLHDRLRDADLAGTVVAVPVVNPPAFDHRSYMSPTAYDARNPNLNRVWPGDDGGSLQERVVARLWGLASDADAAVDLHTGLAHTLEHVRFRADRPAARDLAEAFGTTYLLADGGDATSASGSGADDGEPGTDAGTFRDACARAGIPAVTAELSDSRRVSRAAVETGLDGVLGVLGSLDVLAASPEPAPDRTLLSDDPAPTVAAESGLFEPRPDLAVGDSVAAGERLGAVHRPSTFERLLTVRAEAAGVLRTLARGSAVVAGERIAAVAAPV